MIYLFVFIVFMIIIHYRVFFESFETHEAENGSCSPPPPPSSQPPTTIDSSIIGKCPEYPDLRKYVLKSSLLPCPSLPECPPCNCTSTTTTIEKKCPDIIIQNPTTTTTATSLLPPPTKKKCAIPSS